MVTYTFYLDGVPTAGFQLYSKGFIGGITDYAVSNGSGVITSAAHFDHLQNPNALPAVQAAYAGLKGIDPRDDPDPFSPVPRGDGITDVRFFLATIQVRVRWKAGATTTLLTDRWVGGGFNEWNGKPPPYSLPDFGVKRQLWSHGAVKGFFASTLTDASGIAKYLALFGVAFRDGTIWRLHSPATDESGAVSGRGRFDLKLALRKRERARLAYGDALNISGSTALFLPNNAPYGDVHYVRQLAPNAFGTPGTTDAGYGLSLDYGSAWNPSTGQLDLSGLPGLLTHDYEQSAAVTVLDAAGSPINAATVSFGSGFFTGVTDGAGKVTIPCLPRGSWVKDPDTASSDPVTEILLADASAYPATASSPDSAPHLVTQERAESGSFTLRYAGKSGNTLTGIEGQTGGTGLRENDLYGGEVATLPYSDLAVSVGGTPYTILHASPSALYVHEESQAAIQLTVAPGGTPAPDEDPEGLDLPQDKTGEPYFTAATKTRTEEWLSVGMESDFSRRTAQEAVLSTFSQVLLEDGRRIQHAISSGALRQWITDDLWETSEGPETLAADAAYATCLLREDPDGLLISWPVTSAGAVKRLLSADGGETWTGPEAAATLPSGRPERGDARYLADRWVRAHPMGSGITLYQSFDGTEWEDAGAIAATGKYPWLLVLPTESLLCLYHDGGAIKSRYGHEADGAWTWESAVTVASVPETGPVGFANAQKALCWFRNGSDLPVFYSSFDGGATWEAGSEG